MALPALELADSLDFSASAAEAVEDDVGAALSSDAELEEEVALSVLWASEAALVAEAVLAAASLDAEEAPVG